jgi:hypothetical protein
MKYEHPHIPFYANVGPLGVGRKIKVKGKSEYQHGSRFCINLGVAPMFRENIALHISARHEENCIVVTHCHNGVWGVEQRLHNPIHSRERFEFKIHVEHEFYKIYLSDWSGIDHHLTSIPFVYPPAAVNHIEIEGGVKIDHIYIEGHSEGGAVVVEGMAMPGMPMYRPPMVVEQPMYRPPMVVEQPMYRPPMVVESMYRPPMVVEPMRPMMPQYPPMMMPNTVIVEERRPNVVVVEPPVYPMYGYESHHHHHHHGW